MEFFVPETGGRGVNFESFAELSVLATGLKVIREIMAKSNANERAIKDVDALSTTVTDMVGVQERLLGEPRIAEIISDEHSFKVGFEDPGFVYVAEIAVQIVASNPPDENQNEHLQDPLRYQLSRDMAIGYKEAAAAQGVEIPGY
jgi:hypothetical protein